MPTPLREVLFVFLGGAIGTLLRHGTDVVLGDGLISLFAVNTLGALGLAWFVTRFAVGSGPLHALFAVGLLGSFTTFSAFAIETVLLADGGSWLGAGGWVLGSLAAGVAAAVAGRLLAESMIGGRA